MFFHIIAFRNWLLFSSRSHTKLTGEATLSDWMKLSCKWNKISRQCSCWESQLYFQVMRLTFVHVLLCYHSTKLEATMSSFAFMYLCDMEFRIWHETTYAFHTLIQKIEPNYYKKMRLLNCCIQISESFEVKLLLLLWSETEKKTRQGGSSFSFTVSLLSSNIHFCG